jgi:hypothetical protein
MMRPKSTATNVTAKDAQGSPWVESKILSGILTTSMEAWCSHAQLQDVNILESEGIS